MIILMNQKGFAPILILVIVLVIAGIAGGAYYLGTIRNKQLVQTQNPFVQTQESTSLLSPTPVTSVSELTKTEEINGWKSYTNSRYGFSFSYPLSANLSEFDIDTSIPNLLYTIYIDLKNSSLEVQSPTSQGIRVWKNLGIDITNSESRDSWCSLLQPSLTGQLGCNFEGKLEEVKFNSYKAFKSSAQGRDSHLTDVYYIPYKDFVFQIEVNKRISKTTGNGFETIEDVNVDKLFSTFKFN